MKKSLILKLILLSSLTGAALSGCNGAGNSAGALGPVSTVTEAPTENLKNIAKDTNLGSYVNLPKSKLAERNIKQIAYVGNRGFYFYEKSKDRALTDWGFNIDENNILTNITAQILTVTPNLKTFNNFCVSTTGALSFIYTNTNDEYWFTNEEGTRTVNFGPKGSYKEPPVVQFDGTNYLFFTTTNASATISILRPTDKLPQIIYIANPNEVSPPNLDDIKFAVAPMENQEVGTLSFLRNDKSIQVLNYDLRAFNSTIPSPITKQALVSTKMLNLSKSNISLSLIRYPQTNSIILNVMEDDTINKVNSVYQVALPSLLYPIKQEASKDIFEVTNTITAPIITDNYTTTSCTGTRFAINPHQIGIGDRRNTGNILLARNCTGHVSLTELSSDLYDQIAKARSVDKKQSFNEGVVSISSKPEILMLPDIAGMKTANVTMETPKDSYAYVKYTPMIGGTSTPNAVQAVGEKYLTAFNELIDDEDSKYLDYSNLYYKPGGYQEKSIKDLIKATSKTNKEKIIRFYVSPKDTFAENSAADQLGEKTAIITTTLDGFKVLPADQKKYDKIFYDSKTKIFYWWHNQNIQQVVFKTTHSADLLALHLGKDISYSDLYSSISGFNDSGFLDAAKTLTALQILEDLLGTHNTANPIGRNQNLRVYVARFHGSYMAGGLVPYSKAWNHDKIVRTDSKLLVGGINGFSGSYKGDPLLVNDLSLFFNKNQALSDLTYEYLSLLSKKAGNQGELQPNGGDIACYFNKKIVTDSIECNAEFNAPKKLINDKEFNFNSTSRPESGDYILSVGKSPDDSTTASPAAAEEAITMLIKSAKTEIDIAQQRWFYAVNAKVAWSDQTSKMAKEIVPHIIDAMERGVNVNIAISGSAGSIDNKLDAHTLLEDWDAMYQETSGVAKICNEFKANTKLKGYDWDLVSKHLFVTAVAQDPLVDPDHNSLDRTPAHYKIFMVDGKDYYVGSENLYYNLHAEYGVIIQSERLTADFKNTFWDPMWKNSMAGRDASQLMCK